MKPFELIAALMAQEKLGPLPLAKRMGQPKLQPQIHRFVKGEVAAPSANTAVPLASYFKLPLEAIYDEKVATDEARARGLLDAPAFTAAPVQEPALFCDPLVPTPEKTVLQRSITKVPLISWVQAGPWAETCNVLDLGAVERWLDCPVPHSDCTAALQVRGDSMTAAQGAPRTYPEGSFIFVDFEKRSPVNGQRIIAKLENDDMVTFKVFKDEDGQRWLLPLNPLHRPIYDHFSVLGTVIGTWLDE